MPSVNPFILNEGDELWYERFQRAMSLEELSVEFDVSIGQLMQRGKKILELQRNYEIFENWDEDDEKRPISHLGLSTRSENRLKNDAICTVGEAIKYFSSTSDDSLLRAPNFGKKSLIEIRRKFPGPEALNLDTINMTPYQRRVLVARGILSIETLRKLLEQSMKKVNEQVGLGPNSIKHLRSEISKLLLIGND